jgi:UDP-N-acetylmuramyl tripeptide synthase
MYRLIVIWLGKCLLWATRLRGGGSALPGLVVEKIAPSFLENCADHFDMTALVAGTNGKTTTTKMMRSVLEADGRRVVTNAAGSNMPRGIISAIIWHMDWQGNLQADVGLFEIDEGFAPQVAKSLEPRAITVLNLLRDQLDRYGELNRTAQLIADASPHAETAILNADDPLVAELGGGAPHTVYFGADGHIRKQVPHDGALHQDEASGDVREMESQEENRLVRVRSAEPAESGQHLELDVAGDAWSLYLQMAGVFNAYNAAAAATLGYLLEVPGETATRALESVAPAFGRSERIQIGDKHVTLLLVKNPAGFNQIIDTYLSGSSNSAEGSDIPTLISINDNYADGRDVSWLWDVNIEKLAGTGEFITGGIRGYDMALRLHYAEITSQTELEPEVALETLLERIPEGGEGYIVPTYTAMLQLRKLLSKYTTLQEAGE